MSTKNPRMAICDDFARARVAAVGFTFCTDEDAMRAYQAWIEAGHPVGAIVSVENTATARGVVRVEGGAIELE